jgi:hypothetical protein
VMLLVLESEFLVLGPVLHSGLVGIC